MMSPLEFFAKCYGYLTRNLKYLSLKKICNMLFINIQYYLKTDRVSGHPYEVTVELTNICNSNCALCPTGQGFSSRPKGLMPFERFKYVIDKIKDFTYTLSISQWGDPLINQDAYRMIEYAHQNKIYTFLSTNMHAFKIEDAGRLVASGLDEIAVSLHGLSEETYAAYQAGKNLEAVLRKIRAITAEKKRLNCDRPKIVINFVVTRKNENEIKHIEDFSRKLGVDYSLSTASLNLRLVGLDRECKPLGYPEEQVDAVIRKRLEEWLPKSKESQPYVRGCYRAMERQQKREIFHRKMMACDWPWRKMVINWDGGVTICCGIFDKRYDFGNIFEEPLEKIWNNEKYRLSRRTFRAMECDQGIIPCAGCPGWRI